MAYERQKIEIEGYKLLYEDIDGHQTEGIPSREYPEVLAFLRSTFRLKDSCLKKANDIYEELKNASSPEPFVDLPTVVITHNLSPRRALAKYHIRFFSSGLIVLDREGYSVSTSEESAHVDESRTTTIGKFER